jgi:predicted component of type VI protein secretion system
MEESTNTQAPPNLFASPEPVALPIYSLREEKNVQTSLYSVLYYDTTYTVQHLRIIIMPDNTTEESWDLYKDAEKLGSFATHEELNEFFATLAPAEDATEAETNASE